MQPMNSQFYSSPYPPQPPVPMFKSRQIREMARHQLRGQWRKALVPMLIIMTLMTLPSVLIQLINMPETIGEMTQTFSTMESETFAETPSLSPAASGLLSLLSVYVLLVTGPFSFSLADLVLRIIRKEDYSNKTAFSGFSQFFRNFGVFILTGIFTILWGFVFLILPLVILTVGISTGSNVTVVLGVVLSLVMAILYAIFILRYEMAFFIAVDEPHLSASDAIRKSIQIMKQNTVRLFCLDLSFIGWIILTALPIAIATDLLYSGLLSGNPVLVFLGVLLFLAGFVGYVFLNLYMNTASAIFYSGLAGYFSVAGQEEDVPLNPIPGATDSIVNAKQAGIDSITVDTGTFGGMSGENASVDISEPEAGFTPDDVPPAEKNADMDVETPDSDMPDADASPGSPESPLHENR